MRYFFILILGIFFFGCSDEPSSNTNETSSNKEVSVFMLAPLVNAVVTDASNQVAQYEPTKSKYIFTNPITYPISVTSNSTTYIDTDYDNKLTSADIKPLNMTLKSFCNEVNIITTLYYSGEYQDNNVTIKSFKNDIKNRFGIDICTQSATHIQNAKVSFGAYNYVISDNNLTKVEDISSEVAKVDDFFINYLNNIDVDKIKYYSYYDSLIQLDRAKATRADTLHQPYINTIIREKATPTNTYSNLDVRDIYLTYDYVYTASAHDEFAYLDLYLKERHFLGDGDLDAFGVDLFFQAYNNKGCLYLSDKKYGIIPFEISSNTPVKKSRIYRYFDENNQEQNLTDKGIVSLSGYTTISENKRFIGISTEDKGYYLLNATNLFNNCELARDIKSSDMLIKGDSNTSISAYFRDDGSYLYVTNKADGITRYDLRTPTQADINNSKKTFTLKDNAEAYNIKLFPNSNELLVSTDKGLQIYDITNDDDLTYVATYPTEGAKISYLAQIEFANDFIVYTDGDKGLKILKLDSSYHPMLCGAEYFASASSTQDLAKVTSARYLNGFLYVGFESYGVSRIKFEDLLFKHCK
jgi:hypothetical protein